MKIVTEIGTREISRADAMEERTVTEAVREASRTATEERAAMEAVREASRAATEERAATEAVREASRAVTEEIVATEAAREASRTATEERAATEAVREASRAVTEEMAVTEAAREASRTAMEEIIATEAVREASRTVTEERTVTEAAVRAVTARIGLEEAVTAQIKTATAAAGRDGNRRSGGRDGGSRVSFDTPIQAKPTSGRQQNKNAHKNDRFDKRDHEDEAKGKNSRSGKTGKGAFIMPQPKKEEAKVEDIKTIVIPETLTIRELAEKMKLQPSVIVKKLFLKGQMVTLNQEIDYEKAEEIALEFDVLCEKEEKVDVIAELLKEDEENPEDMVPRPPVVCVMGHVDHGKTSLLDAIRQTNVTAKEAGGITQHIGASVIEINGRKITFLDTPGHEAFTAMRMRGAQSTDIAILVVAADDGVMPQTIEAINHAKAANVEIIVAINKIDKPSANVEKVKQELSEYELIPEDWGGSTVFVPVSAHTKEGITDLLEMILLTADVLELKANPNRKGRGLVIEAELDKGKGPVATVLVQKGTLRVGDTIAAGACYGKIRAMMDDRGRRVKEAGPSMPVEILGLNDVPQAGEVFVATENEKEARNFAETFISESKNKLIEDTKAKLSLDDLFSQIKAGNVKELPIIVKADVQGSVEAVRQSLTKLSNEEVVVKVIHGRRRSHQRI